MTEDSLPKKPEPELTQHLPHLPEPSLTAMVRWLRYYYSHAGLVVTELEAAMDRSGFAPDAQDCIRAGLHVLQDLQKCTGSLLLTMGTEQQEKAVSLE